MIPCAMVNTASKFRQNLSAAFLLFYDKQTTTRHQKHNLLDRAKDSSHKACVMLYNSLRSGNQVRS